METNKPNWVQWVSAVLIITALCFAYSANANVKNIDVPEVDYVKINAMVLAAQNDVTVPTAAEIAALVEVENADNNKLNEFLEDYFGAEYTDIEDAAEDFATDELEHDDYEVVVDYLKTLVENLDEDSVDVDVRDVEVVVTALGLEEDEDKAATVEFELKVRYDLEEGVDDTLKKTVVVKYNVVFDEGDLDDEDVTLVSIQ